MNKPIVIFGAGQIAELAYYYFSHDTKYKVSAFTIDREYIQTESLYGLPVVAFDEVSNLYPPSEFDFFVALAYAKQNAVRMDKVIAAKQKGYKLISYISSHATVLIDRSHIGENCFILENNTIQPFSKIGNNVTLWSGNHIGHHTVISDHCFISSHVVICGNVNVGERCFLGVNSTIRDGITIGDSSIIGAASWVSENMPENSVCTPPASNIKLKRTTTKIETFIN